MRRKIITLFNLLIVISLLCVVSTVSGEEYSALKGLKSVKAVFDVRVSNPKGAALLLKLAYDTYKDNNIMTVTKKPDFVVIFMGSSVKLISKNKEGFSAEEQKALDEIATTISKMSKDGMKLEICLFAAKVFSVDPASVLPGIKHVPNGWVSLIGYEAKGYSLVPVY
jgi:intracellular sulfur oxidation DsrE/DsrF family protein